MQLFTLESNYLTDTSHSGGNILQGFEGYLKNPPGGRRKYEIGDADRMFSNSSVTHKKVRLVHKPRVLFRLGGSPRPPLSQALELAGEGEESTGTMDEHHHSRMSTPGLTTVVLPPAKQEMTAAQQKKHRDREYQRKKRANAARRSAQLSDDESVTSSSGRRPNKRARMADDD